MTDKPTDPVDEQTQSDDDTEGHTIGAAVVLSGLLGTRSSEVQYAREDALPLDEPAGRPHKSAKSDGSSASNRKSDAR